MTRNRWDETDEQKPWRSPSAEAPPLDLYIDPKVNRDAANAVAYSIVKMPAKLHFTAPPTTITGGGAFELKPGEAGEFRKQMLVALGPGRKATAIVTLDLERQDGGLRFVEELRQKLAASAASPPSVKSQVRTVDVERFLATGAKANPAAGAVASPPPGKFETTNPGTTRGGKQARGSEKSKRTG